MNPDSTKLEQIELFKAAVESCKCGVTIADATDPELPLIYANRAFETITGYSSEDYLGKNCRFLQGDLANDEQRNRIREAIASRQSVTEVLRNRRRDGTVFWNELHISPVKTNGVLTHFIGIQNEVTAEVEAKQQLEKSQASLRHSLKEQEHLLGIAAHDLRNPLALVHSLAELAKDAPAGESEGILQTILEVSDRALGMVSEILNLQAIQHGRIQLKRQELDLADFLKRYGVSARTTCDLKQIEFATEIGEIPSTASFDPGRIGRVLDNLLTNAVKYSHRGSRITLRVRSSSGQLRMSVEDQGQGIAESDLPRLFEPFGKTSTAPTEGEQGSGLGLTISKRLAEMHGGTIEVASEPGKGSTFTLCIPLQA